MKQERFLEKAEQLRPKLIEKENVLECDRLLNRGDTVMYDFGDHFVGYLSFEFERVGPYPDSPLQLHLDF